MNVVSRRCNIVYQNLDQYDMVYGPMCANVESVVNNHKDAKTHHIVKYQMTSKSTAYDHYISNKLAAVIFL